MMFVPSCACCTPQCTAGTFVTFNVHVLGCSSLNLSGATVEIDGPSGFSASGTTDASGNYTTTSTYLGDYTVTASYGNLVAQSSTLTLTSFNCGASVSLNYLLLAPPGHVCCGNRIGRPETLTATCSAGTFTASYSGGGWVFGPIGVSMGGTVACTPGTTFVPRCDLPITTGTVTAYLSLSCETLDESWQGTTNCGTGCDDAHNVRVDGCGTNSVSNQATFALEAAYPITVSLPTTGTSNIDGCTYPAPVSGDVVIDT